ncbi:MAG: hypothetical protein AAGI53_01740 [Planctomycetota bacterium]
MQDGDLGDRPDKAHVEPPTDAPVDKSVKGSDKPPGRVGHRAMLPDRPKLYRYDDPASTTSELVERYAAHMMKVYRKADGPTKHARRAERVARLFEYSNLGECPPHQFGPRMLVEFRTWLAGDPLQRWSRPTINEYSRTIVEAFRWGVERELVRVEIFQALDVVKPLRRGRAPAEGLGPCREHRKIRAADPEHLRMLIAMAPPMLAAMIELQTLTAMRPIELVTMRRRALLKTPVEDVHAYAVEPEGNKLDHLELDRTVWLGPRSWSLVSPWLPDDPDAFIWSPKRAEAMRNAAKRAARRTPRWGGAHDPDERQRRKGRPAKIGSGYTTSSYGRALARLCDKVFDPSGERRDAKNTSYRISPNRLRHTGATEITRQRGLEVAKLMLGHRDVSTTLIYAELSSTRAAEAARDLG